jgi:hypothetical protein
VGLEKAIRLLGILTLTDNMETGSSSVGSNDVNCKAGAYRRVMQVCPALYLSDTA